MVHLYEAWCAAGHVTTAWTFARSTSTYTAFPPCEPCIYVLKGKENKLFIPNTGILSSVWTNLMCCTSWWLLENDLRHCWHWCGFTLANFGHFGHYLILKWKFFIVFRRASISCFQVVCKWVSNWYFFIFPGKTIITVSTVSRSCREWVDVSRESAKTVKVSRV